LIRYEKQWKIKVINLKENVWKKKAIAEWISLSKWKIIAMSDSDSVWDKWVIEKIVTIFEVFDNVWWISGHWRAFNASKNIFTKIQDSWYEGQFSIRKAFESVYWSITCVSWPLAVFRRSAIYNYIPAWINDSFLWQEFKFATDRTLTWFVLWWKALWKKLKKQYHNSDFVKSIDYKERERDIVYSKSTKSWTNVPETFWQIISQQIRWKKSFIRNIFLTWYFYWRRPVLPALFYYLHILFVIIWPIISFRHLIYFPIHWDFFSALYYLLWIIFVWLLFWIAFKIENNDSNIWMYRPLMSLLSTLVISWLVFYSLFTIKKMVWTRN
jgi:cellulose synthase/poly-beta-1,6-N-acetylglucosamine synthase-like glycosyltransferase